MTPYQARLVADVLCTADGGCPTCVMNIAREAAERFPDYDWEAMCKRRLAREERRFLDEEKARQAARETQKAWEEQQRQELSVFRPYKERLATYLEKLK